MLFKITCVIIIVALHLFSAIHYKYLPPPPPYSNTSFFPFCALQLFSFTSYCFCFASLPFYINALLWISIEVTQVVQVQTEREKAGLKDECFLTFVLFVIVLFRKSVSWNILCKKSETWAYVILLLGTEFLCIQLSGPAYKIMISCHCQLLISVKQEQGKYWIVQLMLDKTTGAKGHPPNKITRFHYIAAIIEAAALMNSSRPRDSTYRVRADIELDQLWRAENDENKIQIIDLYSGIRLAYLFCTLHAPF